MKTALANVAAEFAVKITPIMSRLIDTKDPQDPIAAQFLHSDKELLVHPEELADPIGDEKFSPIEGIVHRYPDRLLLKLMHICAVHCRFCFRREHIGNPNDSLNGGALDKALNYIQDRKEIWEVILTGGDPLVLSDRRIGEVIERLNAIEHVKVIRIHTRIPVVDPKRITSELVATLRGRAPVYVLLHCNHVRELTEEACSACSRLIDAGIPILSQSVLLRGVNDNPAALAELMRAFVENRIKPHYLHHCDLTRSTSHFRVSLENAQTLLRSLRGRLSGLCQPTYMLDIPGGYGKAPVGPVYGRKEGSGWILEDYQGNTHSYKDICSESPAGELPPKV